MDTNIKMNKMADASVNMLEIKGHEVECFDDNEPGFEKQYNVTVAFKGNEYILIFQPEAPMPMSRDALDRDQGDYRITDFGLNPFETGDDALKLIEAIQKVDGVEPDEYNEDCVEYLEDIASLVCSKIEMEAGYDASDED